MERLLEPRDIAAERLDARTVFEGEVTLRGELDSKLAVELIPEP